MVRYLHHFALVMVLDDRDLTPAQMQSVIGVSQNLIEQYRQLYAELNQPQHTRTLERIKRSVFRSATQLERNESLSLEVAPPSQGKKGGQA